MPRKWFTPRRLLVLGAALAAMGGLTVAGRASDHQDTPEVELNPRMDINDVYAFPGSSEDRIALVLTTSSPLTPAATASAFFDPNILYQLKVDNTGDGVEDLVLQFTFEGTGANQKVVMRGPVKPPVTGVMNQLSDAAPTVSGPLNQVISSNGIQLFAGPRDDPFWIDLEQFFRIIPDRKPVTGVLSQLPDVPTATSFRAPGQAVDFLRGLNCLAIVVELPKSMLTQGGNSKIGIWGTTSR